MNRDDWRYFTIMLMLLIILVVVLSGCSPRIVPFGGEPEPGMVPRCPDDENWEFNITECWWQKERG